MKDLLILIEHLELEIEGEPFNNPDLESKRQKYINWLIAEIAGVNI